MIYDQETKNEISEQLAKKWEWFTEGYKGTDAMNLAILAENAIDTMGIQNGIKREEIERMLTEDVTTTGNLHVNGAGSTALIPKIMFPLIRRVFPNLIANKLVGIQPLTRPTGIIYYLIYKFSNTKGDVLAGDEYNAFPWDGSPRGGYSAYYSMNRIGPFVGTIAASGNTTIVSNQDTFFDQAETGTVPSTRSIKSVEVYNIKTGVSYSTVLTSSVPSAANEVLADATTNVVVLADGSVSSWKGGDEVKIFLVYDQEASEKMPSLNLTIDSMPVTTKERKLKVNWTKESEQDFKAYHQIDIEQELVKAAAQEMSYEIDREIIDFVDRNVIPELSMYHDWVNDTPASGNNTQGNYLDRHRALADKIMRLAAKVEVYNRQGPANWIVCSPQTAAVLAQLPNFKQDLDKAGSEFNIHYMGTLNGRIDVYADPNRGFHVGAGGSAKFSDVLLMGYKAGNDPYKSGIIYSPYTNWMSQTITHPDNFNSIRGFFSRYSITKVPRGQYFYAKLVVDNLII